MDRAKIVAGLIVLLLASCGRSSRIVVGSKNFTEQILLGEILAQQIQRRTIASHLVAIPEPGRIPACDPGGRSPDPQQHLDALEAAAQPAPAADVQQIAVLEIALEIGIQPLADDRKVETAAVERYQRLDAIERGIERHIAHAVAATYGLTAAVQASLGTPPLVNPPDAALRARRAAVSVVAAVTT